MTSDGDVGTGVGVRHRALDEPTIATRAIDPSACSSGRLVARAWQPAQDLGEAQSVLGANEIQRLTCRVDELELRV